MQLSRSPGELSAAPPGMVRTAIVGVESAARVRPGRCAARPSPGFAPAEVDCTDRFSACWGLTCREGGFYRPGYTKRALFQASTAQDSKENAMQVRSFLLFAVVSALFSISSCGGDEQDVIIDTASPASVSSTQSAPRDAELRSIQPLTGATEEKDDAVMSPASQKVNLGADPGETSRCKGRGSRCIHPLECCSWLCGVFTLRCQ